MNREPEEGDEPFPRGKKRAAPLTVRKLSLMLLGCERRSSSPLPDSETQGLELVLGVGERCTVTSAIQRPGSGHLRASDGADMSIMVPRRRKPNRVLAVCLSPAFSFFFLAPPRSV